MRADGAPPDSPIVVGFDRTETEVVDVGRWVALARTTLAGESVAVGQLDLIFVDAGEMAELNLAHMDHAGPTDVLSFPLDAESVTNGPDPTADARAGMDLDFGSLAEERVDDDAGSATASARLHLGDVIICPEVALRQAPEHCGEIEAELSLLVIHGILHVLGHDHGEPAESQAMRSRERHYMAQLGYGHPEPS